MRRVRIIEPTRAEYEISDSGLELTHKPTGATFTTYDYPDPNNTAVSGVNWGIAGDEMPGGIEYDRTAVGTLAEQILREHAFARHADD